MKTLLNYNISEAKQALIDLVRSYCAKDESGNYLMPMLHRIPPYLNSDPGIGKTDIVEQVANECNIGLVRYSLAHHTRNSMQGLPVICEGEDGKYTEYTVSELIAAVREQYSAGYHEGILFLDEFPCMSDTVAPIMLSFLQRRELGKHTMPEGWIIVLAGNPIESNRSSRRFDVATTDRMRVINIECDASAWLEYAEKTGVYGDIIEYISLYREQLYNYDPENKEEVVTPRSWTNLSETMKIYEKLGLEIDRRLISQFVKCPRIASGFWKYHQENGIRISMDDMNAIYERGKLSADYDMILHRVCDERDCLRTYRSAEMICDYAVNRATDEITGLVSEEGVCAGHIENVYGFLKEMDTLADDTGSDHTYVSLLTDRINRKPELLRYISRNPIPSYNRCVMAAYDVMAG